MAAALGAAVGLVALPAGPASAAVTACAWHATTFELPAGADGADFSGSDSNRYVVGHTGTQPWEQEGSLGDPQATLWDNGKIVWHATGGLPHAWDVNSSGVMAGDTIVDGKFYGITITADGTTKTLPGDPAWVDYDAELINNRGDVVGGAIKADLKHIVVLWPADAPGTYRVLPTPDTGSLFLQDLDEQGEIIGGTQDAPQGAIWTTSGTYTPLQTPKFADPEAVRGGHVVGGWSTFSTYGAGEWNAQGTMTRSIPGSTAEGFTALGADGTIAGQIWVGYSQHPSLWRGGQVVDPLTAVDSGFVVQWISDDGTRLTGIQDWVPTQYHCS